VLHTSTTELIEDVGCVLGRRDTSGYTETFNGKTFGLHLYPERELEGELSLVDV
jgi:hypothetical protein